MRTVVALLIFNAAPLIALAQGTVTFQNSVQFQTPDPTGGGRLVYELGSPLDPLTGVGLTGSQFVAELYVGADAASLAPVTASISRFRSTTTSFPGRWANIGVYGENAFVVLPGFL